MEIANHSDKSDVLRGIIHHLNCISIKNKTLCSKIGLENLLTFVDIGDKKRNSLVESTFTQQNSNQFIEALLELKKKIRILPLRGRRRRRRRLKIFNKFFTQSRVNTRSTKKKFLASLFFF